MKYFICCLRHIFLFLEQTAYIILPFPVKKSRAVGPPGRSVQDYSAIVCITNRPGVLFPVGGGLLVPAAAFAAPFWLFASAAIATARVLGGGAVAAGLAAPLDALQSTYQYTLIRTRLGPRSLGLGLDLSLDLGLDLRATGAAAGTAARVRLVGPRRCSVISWHFMTFINVLLAF